jgi:hypothetical protein
VKRMLFVISFVLIACTADADGLTGFKLDNPRKGFLSRENLLLTGGVAVTGITDVESTFACINTTAYDSQTGRRWYCVEGNRLARPFVERGKLASYGAKTAFVAAVTVPSYYLRRSRHKSLRVVGYVLPIAAMLAQGRATIGNMQNRNFIRSHQ